MYNYSGAIEAAKASMELVEKEKKDEFVRLNTNNLNDWKNYSIKK
ncbi:hypothetical protein [Maribacter sp. ACAM166]|nr:hypothetical protein [Maribacter sp. ACAM166]